MIKTIKLLTFYCLFALAACQQITETTTTAADTALLDQYYKNSVASLFKSRSLTATALGVDEAVTGSYFADQMEDYSPASEAVLRAELRRYQNLISDYNGSLDAAADSNRRVIASIARYYAGHPDFDVGYIDTWMGMSAFIVNQINGPAIDAPQVLQNNHSLKTLKDAQDYITRLEKFDDMLASISAKVQADAAQDWVPPKVIVEKTIMNLDGFTEADVLEHPLYKNFATSLGELTSIDATNKQALLDQAAAAMSTSVYPAYKNLSNTMRGVLSKARDAHGIWAQPNGPAYYQDAINNLGDTDMNADQIHALGLAEVERISSEMNTILTAEGYTTGTVGERMAALIAEPRFLYEDSDAGRAQLLDDLNGYIAEIDVRMDSLFKSRPKFPVEVKRIPVEREVGAPGGQYTSPALDGSNPGVYWINLYDIKANPKLDLKTLTYHEAIPGHHWQIALNLEQESLPLIRRIAPYNAYVEGWALYSEALAVEMGMYTNDPYSDLGRLNAELFRAVRLVVDTGLHHKRWTREQAIQYMSDVTGNAASSVVSEIERYMVWPGQALGYKLGMITIQQARADAEKKLGERFDIREFHDVILLAGASPMAILKENVINWIELKLAAQ